jgi:hypothetical protein
MIQGFKDDVLGDRPVGGVDLIFCLEFLDSGPPFERTLSIVFSLGCR